MNSTLTSTETALLAECEAMIERGMNTFVEVGTALLTISDQRLYRATHSTFNEYISDKWKMTARRAYQLSEAAEVVSQIKASNVNHGSQITNERQARALADIPAEKRSEVMEKASARGKVTARAIKQAALPGPQDADYRFEPELGLQYAKLAICQLEKIHPKDKQRAAAFERVAEWLEKAGYDRNARQP